MLHALGPGHLADMNQAFNALFELHKCTVVRHADNAAMHMGSDRVALYGVEPGIRRELLEPQ